MSVVHDTLQRQQERLRTAIQQALHAIGYAEGEAVYLEAPRDPKHGDIATNVALQRAKERGVSPRALATDIVQALDLAQAGVVRVDIAGPGFINFVMDKTVLREVIRDVYDAGDAVGAQRLSEPVRVLVEFVSANPTGQLHLGHARGAALGDALCRLLAHAGYAVEREYYINDAGNQMNNWVQSLEARYRQALGQESALPEDGYFGEDVVAYGATLAEKEGDRWLREPEEVRYAHFRSFGLTQQLGAIREHLEQFRVTFDHWRSEAALYDAGAVEQTLERLRSSGHVYEQEGAIWLRTTQWGDDKDRVLVKQDGSSTYLLPDIAYHVEKYDRGYDRLINIWGADHHGYVPRVRAAMCALGKNPEQLTVLIAQMVSLYQGGEKVKMSKRTGKAITLAELVHDVGVDATRYFFAMRSADAHLDFDMDLAIATSSDNPVYYVQYAHARICSLFRQAEIDEETVRDADVSFLQTEEEYELLQKLGTWPGTVAEAAQGLAPHRIVRYVYELAACFHRYYKVERLLIEDEQKKRAKLALCVAVRRTIACALRLIGVEAPTAM